MDKLIAQLIAATNAFSVEAALELFSPKAVIADVSVGKTFKGPAGVREYMEEYFVGYHTVTKLESLEAVSAKRAKAFVDFTGDFGHEKGLLDVATGTDGLIISIDAELL